ncbi:unnamed protein product [Coregonus sp. 'balchen']|nr:unnamed protein product [Coregonus sp. 'balchen']
MQKGPVFGNQDLFTGLGVFVDTYPNEEKHLEVLWIYPPASSMCFCAEDEVHTRTQRSSLCVGDGGNGSISYDHERDGRPTELGGCNAMVRNLKNDTSSSSDTSAAGSRHVEIMIDIDGQHEWRDCLDIPGYGCPRGYYFGASAITGDLSGSTPSNTIMMCLPETVPADGCYVVRQRKRGKEEITLPSVDNRDLLRTTIHTITNSVAPLWVRMKRGGVILPCSHHPLLHAGLFLLIVVGLIVYSHWNENRRKRFY